MKKILFLTVLIPLVLLTNCKFNKSKYIVPKTIDDFFAYSQTFPVYLFFQDSTISHSYIYLTPNPLIDYTEEPDYSETLTAPIIDKHSLLSLLKKFKYDTGYMSVIIFRGRIRFLYLSVRDATSALQDEVKNFKKMTGLKIYNSSIDSLVDLSDTDLKYLEIYASQFKGTFDFSKLPRKLAYLCLFTSGIKKFKNCSELEKIDLLVVRFNETTITGCSQDKIGVCSGCPPYTWTTQDEKLAPSERLKKWEAEMAFLKDKKYQFPNLPM